MRYGATKMVLVAGGAGFLGSHLRERLLEQGHEVLCADNLREPTVPLRDGLVRTIGSVERFLGENERV